MTWREIGKASILEQGDLTAQVLPDVDEWSYELIRLRTEPSYMEEIVDFMTGYQRRSDAKRGAEAAIRRNE